ncbi:MAG: hypothetical protein IH611_09445 [Deltaproteobacteria bacterium]|nr:hypothetical protein [Deltaproteobacteria bacterium]
MSDGTEALFLRLLDLARRQKAGIEAGNLDEASTLAETRLQVFREIQGIYGPAGSAGADGMPAAPAAVIRQILSIDAEAAGIAREQSQATSLKLSKINTFKTYCQGVVEEARLRSTAPTR